MRSKSFWVGLFLFAGFSTFGQDELKDIEISLTYGIPRFDNFFRGGYETHPGVVVGVHLVKPRFRYGLRSQWLRFFSRIQSPIQVYKMVYYSLEGMIAYDLLSGLSHRLEPDLTFGYALMRYNDGAFLRSAFVLQPGINYLHRVGRRYSLGIGISVANVLDRFGGPANTSNAAFMQFINISLGFSFLIGPERK